MSSSDTPGPETKNIVPVDFVREITPTVERTFWAGRPTYLQFAGTGLTLVVLLLIALFVIAILSYVRSSTPDLTNFGNPVTEGSLNLYVKTSDAVFNRAKDLLDLVLSKVLFPTLTAVLGYTFAQVRQSSTREE